MAKIKVSPASGMRDFLSLDILKRKYAIDVIERIYQLYGFEPLETPMMERLDVLSGKYGEEGDQLIFKVLKRGQKLTDSLSDSSTIADLGLKYDLTVPLARVVAKYREKTGKIYKRYQIQPVFRADRPAKGRYREFYQCDVDIVGSKSLLCETEVLNAGAHILYELGLKSFTIHLNHRSILKGMMEISHISDEQQSDVLIAIDKLDKIQLKGVIQELINRNVENEKINTLVELITKDFDDSFDTLNYLKEKLKNSQNGIDGVNELEKLLEYLKNGFAEKHIKITPSIARGLNYYTGSIYEIVFNDFKGSCASGGRYDYLVGMFLEHDVPACGFSLGLERILLLLEQRNLYPVDLNKPVDVFVSLYNESLVPETLKLTQQLRENGIKCDVYPQFDKYSTQFKYASKKSISLVVIIGEDELKQGKVSVKNMTDGTQEKVHNHLLVEYIKDKLSSSYDKKIDSMSIT